MYKHDFSKVDHKAVWRCKKCDMIFYEYYNIIIEKININDLEHLYTDYLKYHNINNSDGNHFINFINLYFFFAPCISDDEFLIKNIIT